ncbi:MAG TPA: hypothetical protein PLK77_18230 [Pyrinomonadaceae bacterium]|jgi:hypothetical protein|nr:hypothetical protein [Pyrinomonadaceae bacterium]
MLAIVLVLVPRKGDIYERFEVRQNEWKIRFTARYEEYFFLPGAYWSFESTAPETDDWREFLEFRVDDPIDLPRERIVLVDERIVYINLWHEAPITTDAGKTWRIWRPIYPLSDGELLNWHIGNLEIQKDGKGAAALDAYDSNLDRRITKTVVTQDYGQNWTESTN